MLKGMNTGIPLQRPTSTNNGGMAPSVGASALSATSDHSGLVKKEDLENTVNTAVTNVMSKLETLISTSLNVPQNNMQTRLCHFCGEAGQTMTRGCCTILEQYLHQGKAY